MEAKNILLCVTGGIAAYKAVALTSKLTQKGIAVKVMMSDNATQFVAPLTFQAISRNDVYMDTFDEKDPSKIAHIDLADWPDLIIIAPATANIIGKLAHGIADNMISTTLLATTKPIWIAPAMNVHMYNHPAVQENMEKLKHWGYRFIEPGEGYLACGYVGKGRLAEPETIVDLVLEFFRQQENEMKLEKFLQGKNVIITAGPTREKFDPVRFFSNYSTGKMGYALADQAAKFGANVTLVSGPVSIIAPDNVNLIQVESAEEMYQAVINQFAGADIVIKSAAVADYRPASISTNKIKKHEGGLTIQLERTKDILFELGQRKTKQFLVGFAAETEQLEDNAVHKLNEKNADMIIANDVSRKDAGFGSDTNIVTIYQKNGEKRVLPLMQKSEVALEILKEIDQSLKKEEFHENR